MEPTQLALMVFAYLLVTCVLFIILYVIRSINIKLETIQRKCDMIMRKIIDLK